jgi:hypothetical protein
MRGNSSSLSANYSGGVSQRFIFYKQKETKNRNDRLHDKGSATKGKEYKQ